LINSRR